MRLKSIKLAGFKSFVDPTKVPFPHQLTAIVGPNGCGKSNIIDAVRWVLGEGSAKNLRGDAMTDVIFNGSLERKPISQASVELVFDNESGRVGGEFANYSEVALKRLVTRDGQSKYFLNGNKCRRRDITDIFLGTGLGPRSYAIIEQGMISRLIESKPQELRIFIEEAAGISKYKERRRETENRLKHTRENLERLNDVREELGQQLSKLQRQSSAAQRYKSLKAEERTLKAQLAAIRWLDWQQQHDQLEQKVQQIQLQIEGVQAQRELSQAEQTEQQLTLEQSTQTHEDARQALFQISNQITRLEQQILHQSQHQQRVEQELKRLHAELAEQGEYIEEQRESLALYDEELLLLKEQEAEASFIMDEAGDALRVQEQALQTWQSQFQQSQDRLSDLRQQLSASQHQQQLLQQQKAQLNLEQERLKAQQQELQQQPLALQKSELHHQRQSYQAQVDERQESVNRLNIQLEKSQHAYQQALSQVQDRQQQMASLKGQLKALQQWLPNESDDLQALGAQSQKLSELLTIEQGWESVVELVLGPLAKALCVEGSFNELPLSQLPLDQALLFSVNTTDPKPGTLARLVSGHSGIISRLNEIQVAHSEDELKAIQAQLLPHQSVVTQDGIWAGSNWLCRAGKTQGELAIRAEIAGLEQQIESFEQDLLQQETLTAELKKNSELQQVELSRERDELNRSQTTLAQVNSDLRHLDEKIRLQQTQAETLEAELEASQLKAEELEQELMISEESSYLLQEQVEEMALEYESHQAERERIERALSQARLKRDEQQSAQHQQSLQIASLTNKVESAKAALERAEQQQKQAQQRCLQLEQELEVEVDDGVLRDELEQQLALKIEAEQECALLSERMQQAQQALIELKQQEQQLMNEQSQLKQKQDGLALDQQTARVRAESATESLQEMDQPLKEVLENLPEEYSEPIWQERIETIGRSVSRLGPINLAAIEEYEQCGERKAYLDQQNDDLVQALETLESAIRRIDRECRSRFKETYDKVNADLKMLFPKVFGGGMAYLELTGDDLLETGVTIMARPPGKRNATIHLLSGGEKALTALSLVFAIFRLNPAPFCMLDEVDAPLDDANVGRFCNLVREMAETVQFIYISHNKVTMEMADQLAGVTMHEPGVSRLVAVDVDEAVALAKVS